eukprot:scaffold24263_cov69-Phaeocystis_antarctica.AAC.2
MRMLDAEADAERAVGEHDEEEHCLAEARRAGGARPHCGARPSPTRPLSSGQMREAAASTRHHFHTPLRLPLPRASAAPVP